MFSERSISERRSQSSSCDESLHRITTSGFLFPSHVPIKQLTLNQLFGNRRKSPENGRSAVIDPSTVQNVDALPGRDRWVCNPTIDARTRRKSRSPYPAHAGFGRLQVAHGRFHVGVTEPLLNCTQIDASHSTTSRKSRGICAGTNVRTISLTFAAVALTAVQSCPFRNGFAAIEEIPFGFASRSRERKGTGV